MKQVRNIITACMCFGLLFAACTPTSETVIKVTYTHTPEPNVYINLPVDGHYFTGGYQKYPLSADNRYESKLAIDKPGIVSIANNAHPVYLYVSGGEQFDITVNEGRLTVTGPNAEGQQLYNELFKDNTGERYVELSQTPLAGDRVKLCNQLKEADMQKFNTLLTGKKITPGFYAFMEQEANAYYALLLTTNIYFVYQSSKYAEGETVSAYNDDFRQAWATALKPLEDENPSMLQSRFSPKLFSWYYALLESEGKVADVTKEPTMPPIYKIFII